MASTNPATVLVTGATGNQGGAVARALVDNGLNVRAMVRNPDKASPKTDALRAMGADVVRGDFEDAASLQAALEGTQAVFGMTTMMVGVDREVVHGKALVDAVAQIDPASRPFLVYSSVSDADKATGIPHFDSKYAVERYIADNGLSDSAAITAPAFFYDNILFPWNLGGLRDGQFGQALPGTRELQMVSLRDIGRFNALVLSQPERFAGRRIDYAGDSLTPEAMVAALGQALGREVAYREQSLDDVRDQFEDMAAMYSWFDRVGYSVDIEALHSEFPEVGWWSFSNWTNAQDWPRLLGL